MTKHPDDNKVHIFRMRKETLDSGRLRYDELIVLNVDPCEHRYNKMTNKVFKIGLLFSQITH